MFCLSLLYVIRDGCCAVAFGFGLLVWQNSYFRTVGSGNLALFNFSYDVATSNDNPHHGKNSPHFTTTSQFFWSFPSYHGMVDVQISFVLFFWENLKDVNHAGETTGNKCSCHFLKPTIQEKHPLYTAIGQVCECDLVSRNILFFQSLRSFSCHFSM